MRIMGRSILFSKSTLLDGDYEFLQGAHGTDLMKAFLYASNTKKMRAIQKYVVVFSF